MDTQHDSTGDYEENTKLEISLISSSFTHSDTYPID